MIRKFFLHVSRDEQKKRFLERIEQPEKNWKFSAADVRERGHWDAYMDAYEKMIRETASKEAPWYVVPADNKWFTRLVVAAAVVDALASLDLHYPEIDKKQRAELEAARQDAARREALRLARKQRHIPHAQRGARAGTSDCVARLPLPLNSRLPVPPR